jgi:hypothetical protein
MIRLRVPVQIVVTVVLGAGCKGSGGVDAAVRDAGTADVATIGDATSDSNECSIQCMGPADAQCPPFVCTEQECMPPCEPLTT